MITLTQGLFMLLFSVLLTAKLFLILWLVFKKKSKPFNQPTKEQWYYRDKKLNDLLGDV